MRLWLVALTTGSLVCAARHAAANDPAAAQALFDQAQALMSQERWSEACPKLEESQRLDPGGGTLLHLAACREHEGKTATAWAHYQDALAAAKRDNRKDRAKIAQGRIDALGPRLRKLRIRVASKDKKLPGFRVMRDETPVGAALWEEPFPIDPGPHIISATADGYKRWSTNVDIKDKGGDVVISVDVPELDADPASDPPPQPKTEDPRPPIRLEDATRGDSQRTVGIAMGGLGAIGLVVGGVFGALALSRTSTADENCQPPDRTQCTQAGVDAGLESKTFGNVSTVALIAGGVFAVGGGIVYFSAPRHAARAAIAPLVGPGAVGLTMGGRF